MATTKAKVRAKVIVLLDDIRPHLEQKLEKLLDSGAINFEQEDDTWGLPQDIIQALAKEMAWQYKHPHPPYGYQKRIERFFNNM